MRETWSEGQTGTLRQSEIYICSHTASVNMAAYAVEREKKNMHACVCGEWDYRGEYIRAVMSHKAKECVKKM